MERVWTAATPCEAITAFLRVPSDAWAAETLPCNVQVEVYDRLPCGTITRQNMTKNTLALPRLSDIRATFADHDGAYDIAEIVLLPSADADPPSTHWASNWTD